MSSNYIAFICNEQCPVLWVAASKLSSPNKYEYGVICKHIKPPNRSPAEIKWDTELLNLVPHWKHHQAFQASSCPPSFASFSAWHRQYYWKTCRICVSFAPMRFAKYCVCFWIVLCRTCVLVAGSGCTSNVGNVGLCTICACANTSIDKKS